MRKLTLFNSITLDGVNGASRNDPPNETSDVRSACNHREMTRFAIDAPTALKIVADERDIAAEHTLVGPAILRSHALSTLYREARARVRDEKDARQALEGIATLKIRLLGDRVSRATAFKLAAQLGWDDTPLAEYLAVASLQADALITEDPGLATAASGVVRVAAYEDLFR
jgi:hypothetical protein